MTLKAIGCAAALLAVAACGRDQRPPETAMAEARADESSSAIESITEARCARESRCDNIGPDQKYSSMEDCAARVRDDWRGDLDARQCPAGVNRDQLDECLDGIRSEDCSSPFDTLERVAACTAGQICQE